jgi:hypothetical protein
LALHGWLLGTFGFTTAKKRIQFRDAAAKRLREPHIRRPSLCRNTFAQILMTAIEATTALEEVVFKIRNYAVDAQASSQPLF